MNKKRGNLEKKQNFNEKKTQKRDQRNGQNSKHGTRKKNQDNAQENTDKNYLTDVKKKRKLMTKLDDQQKDDEKLRDDFEKMPRQEVEKNTKK